MDLYDAVRKNRLEDVKRMLGDPDVDVNSVAYEGRTAFMEACVFRRAAMIRLFLDSKRDINYNQANNNNCTAFHWACYYGDRAILEMFLADQRINVFVFTLFNENCFHAAIWGAERHVSVEVLLASDRPGIGQLINGRDRDGRTPRDLAQEEGILHLVELFNAYNADPVGVRDELRIELYPEYMAAELFATIVLLCDDYYEIKRE